MPPTPITMASYCFMGSFTVCYKRLFENVCRYANHERNVVSY